MTTRYSVLVPEGKKALLVTAGAVCLYVGASNWLASQVPQSKTTPEVFSHSLAERGSTAETAGSSHNQASVYHEYKDDGMQPVPSDNGMATVAAEGLQGTFQLSAISDNKGFQEIIDRDRLRSGPVDYGLTPNHIGLRVDPETILYAPIDHGLEPLHVGVSRGSYIEADGPIDYALEPRHIGPFVDPDLVRTTPVDRGLQQNHIGTKLDPYHERAD